MRSLFRLVQRETMGQRARFERFAANMLYMIASGRNIDTDRVETFGAQLDEIYANPFGAKKEKGPQTAAEVKDYILDKIRKRIQELEE